MNECLNEYKINEYMNIKLKKFNTQCYKSEVTFIHIGKSALAF